MRGLVADKRRQLAEVRSLWECGGCGDYVLPRPSVGENRVLMALEMRDKRLERLGEGRPNPGGDAAKAAPVPSIRIDAGKATRLASGKASQNRGSD